MASGNVIASVDATAAATAVEHTVDRENSTEKRRSIK